MKYRLALLAILLISLSGCSVFDPCDGDCKNGYGSYSYDNGGRYEGQWKDGRASGEGTFYYVEGRYEGQYKYGEQHGYGTIYYGDGTVTEAKRIFGKRHGIATHTTADGKVYKRRFWEGKLRGIGYRKTKAGGRQEGMFYDSKLKGIGIEYAKHGEILKAGIWDDGKLQEAKNAVDIKKQIEAKFNIITEYEFLVDNRLSDPYKNVLNEYNAAYLMCRTLDNYELDAPCTTYSNCYKDHEEWFKVGRKLYKKEVCDSVPSYSPIVNNISAAYSVSKQAVKEYIVFLRDEKSAAKVLANHYPYFDYDWVAAGEREQSRNLARYEAEKAAEKRRQWADFNKEISGYIASGQSFKKTEADKIFDDTNRSLSNISYNSIQKQRRAEQKQRIEVERRVNSDYSTQKKYLYKGKGPYTEAEIKRIYKLDRNTIEEEAIRSCKKKRGVYDKKIHTCFVKNKYATFVVNDIGTNETSNSGQGYLNIPKRNSGLTLNGSSKEQDNRVIANKGLSGFPVSSHKEIKECIADKGTWVQSKNACYGLGVLMEHACKSKFSGTVSGTSPSTSRCYVYLSKDADYAKYRPAIDYAGKSLSNLTDVKWERTDNEFSSYSDRSKGK